MNIPRLLFHHVYLSKRIGYERVIFGLFDGTNMKDMVCSTIRNYCEMKLLCKRPR